MAVVILRGPDNRSAKRHSPQLEYLKAVNSVAPPKDPELMFILMGEFASSNLQDEGADFFSARLKEVEPQLTPVQKSLYLGIIGLLRAQQAARWILRKMGDDHGRAKAIPPIFVGKRTTNILLALDERGYRYGQLERRLQGVSP